MDINPEHLEAWKRRRADWPRGQPQELRTLLRRIPLDANLPTDDGELRFERLDVYAEGALLHFYYLRRREDSTPRKPSMWLGATAGGGSGLWFQVPGPEDDDYPDAEVSAEPPTEWAMVDNFPPTPEPTVAVTDDRGNRYEGLPGAGGGNDRERHFTHHVARPLDPRATELRVEVTDLIWTHFPDALPGEPSTMVIDRVQRGPWRTVIRL